MNKLKQISITQLTQGVTPEKLALSCALAVVCGLFPFMGTTTLLVFLAALYFRLNQPIMQILNYALTPLQLIGILFFLRVGETLVGATPVSINPLTIASQFFEDWRLFFSLYGMASLHALLAWILIAPILGFIIYYSLLPLFRSI